MSCFRHPFMMGNVGNNRLDAEEEEEISERLRKTFYYGRLPTTDRPSLPLTDFTVEFFCEAAPRKLGKLDHYVAASTSRQNCMSPCSMMMGMLYTKRLRQHNPEYLRQISSSDLFLISMMMASKFLYDDGVDDEVFNDEWANSVDLETEEINEMERQFLSAIDWQLFVRKNDFEAMLHEVEKRIALRQGKERDWFSYTDLWVLSQDPQFQLLWRQVSKEISKVFVVTAVTYVAGILTMIGSTMFVMTAASTISCLTPVVPPFIRPAVLPPSQSPVLNSGSEYQSSSRRGSESGPESKHSSTCSVILKQIWTILTLPSLLSLSESKREPTNDSTTGVTDDILNTEGPQIHDALERQSFDNNKIGTMSSPTSPIWTMMTLQDTLIIFFGAVKDKLFQSRSQNEHLPKVSNPSVCDNGYCLPNNRNCRNVSTEFDHGYRKSSDFSNCISCSRLRQETTRPTRFAACVRNRLSSNKNPELLGTSDDDAFKIRSDVKCCCDISDVQENEIDRGPLLGHFSDISVGFHTGFHANYLLKT